MKDKSTLAASSRSSSARSARPARSSSGWIRRPTSSPRASPSRTRHGQLRSHLRAPLRARARGPRGLRPRQRRGRRRREHARHAPSSSTTTCIRSRCSRRKGRSRSRRSEPDTDQPGARPRLVVLGAHRDRRRSARRARRRQASAPRPRGPRRRVEPGGLGAPLPAARARRSRRSPASSPGRQERAHVVALDEEGHPQVRAVVDPQGRFAIDAPIDGRPVVRRARGGRTRARRCASCPGAPGELKLDVSAGGELAREGRSTRDTKQPLVARLIVKGIEGTLDPSFGPDYRASGAGPLMDVLEGEVKTPLPAGQVPRRRDEGHRVEHRRPGGRGARAVTRRPIELALASRRADAGHGRLRSARARAAELRQPGHPRGSRALARLGRRRLRRADRAQHRRRLRPAARGAPPLEAARARHRASRSRPTTRASATSASSRTRRTRAFRRSRARPPARVFAAAKRGDPHARRPGEPPAPAAGHRLLQHRQLRSEGRARRPRACAPTSTRIEVYNGYDLASASSSSRCSRTGSRSSTSASAWRRPASSDSHRIQYQWAGYPRTMALVDAKAAGDTRPADRHRGGRRRAQEGPEPS